MMALALLLSIPVLMWGGQTVFLLAARAPIRWRLSPRGLPSSVQRANRVLTKCLFVVVLAAFPLLRGESPVAYYGRFLPPAAGVGNMLYGVLAALLYLTLLYLAWVVTGNVRFTVRHPARKLVRRIAGAALTAVFIALAEELLFRAMVLADLLRTLPAGVALTVGVLIFALGHYVRSVKRYWTFSGHVMLGVLLCAAFYWTRTIWLPMGVHAGGVFALLAARPFVRYTGPAWLVGASIFPYAGVLGILALAMMTVNLWIRFAVPA